MKSIAFRHDAKVSGRMPEKPRLSYRVAKKIRAVRRKAKVCEARSAAELLDLDVHLWNAYNRLHNSQLMAIKWENA